MIDVACLLFHKQHSICVYAFFVCHLKCFDLFFVVVRTSNKIVFDINQTIITNGAGGAHKTVPTNFGHWVNVHNPYIHLISVNFSYVSLISISDCFHS